MFEGDDFQFTLNVAETGKDPKTVTVNLRQNADLTTAAVFIVHKDESGTATSIERLTGIKRYNGISNKGGSSHTVNFGEAEGTRLLDMLVWIDSHELASSAINTNPNNNAEYLVRVAASELMPCVTITYEVSMPIPAGGEPGGKIRMRGAGNAERVIRPQDGAMEYSNIYFKSYGANDPRSGNSIGSMGNQPFIVFYKGGTLQLEKNITLVGNEPATGLFKSPMILLDQGHLIMKDGAVIKEHNPFEDVHSRPIIYLRSMGNTYAVLPRFNMEGGSIINNGAPNLVDKYAIISLPATKNTYGDLGWVSRTGGTISGNSGKEISWNGREFDQL
jgi:hypothetical protein